jgi:transposase
MASLQRVRVRGQFYWRIVESRRVNGKPRPIVIAYLGKPDEILARLRSQDSLSLRSRSHGAVACLYSLAKQLDVAGIIDRQLASSGRRVRGRPPGPPPHTPVPPVSNDGLTVGTSLLLAAIGRACHATSKRGFATWARTTTLEELAQVKVERLTSQHFWDQMDQLPIESIGRIEKELLSRVLDRFQLPLDTLLYDATNFFTFIASTNARSKLPARGHNKQKRHDLRQLGLALLCTRQHQVPLWHQLYGGQVPDAKSFPDAVTALSQRLVELGRDLQALTLVYDKGNISRSNQQQVDSSKLHYVAAVSSASQRALVAEANSKWQAVQIDENAEAEAEREVLAYRTRRIILGSQRTVVVVLSRRLQEGQKRGVLQHVASAQRWLQRLAAMLERGKQRRSRLRIQHDIETRLRGRQNLRKVLHVKLEESQGKLSLSHQFDQAALEVLEREWLGRIVLITDRDDWSTAEIIRAYRGQSHVEAVFAHLKDPVHVTLRPQFHWTDQKLHVHVFVCLLAYLLACLLHLHAKRAIGYPHSMERLIEDLEQVRLVRVARRTQTGKGGWRVSSQLEEGSPEIETLLTSLQVTT